MKKFKSIKRYFYFCILAFVCIINGCSKKDANNSDAKQGQVTEVNKITAEKAKQMMDDGDDFILLDVRTEEEYSQERIDGAMLIPDSEIKTRADDDLPDKNVRIFIYCRSGRRSALAAQELVDLGYTKVYDFGGIIDWPYETIN
jgi:rhodanese-related sulfurtransferase